MYMQYFTFVTFQTYNILNDTLGTKEQLKLSYKQNCWQDAKTAFPEYEFLY